MQQRKFHGQTTPFRLSNFAATAALKHKHWIRVVEADTVPRPVIHGSVYIAAADGSRGPIGDRIVEIPEDATRTDLRDNASGFVA